MSDYDFDLFVIGAGSGGVRAARVASGYGAKVAIAEESRVGGTCVIRGCVPKKLLMYGSSPHRFLHMVLRLPMQYAFFLPNKADQLFLSDNLSQNAKLPANQWIDHPSNHHYTHMIQIFWTIELELIGCHPFTKFA